MTDTTLHQTYFTVSDVNEIANDLMRLPVVSSNKKVAATQALNVVRILRDRLGAGSEALRFVYTDQTFAPRPLAKFVNEYLEGKYKQHEAEQILDGLQADMRQSYFRRKIPFDDTSRLPRTAIFDPTGEFARELNRTLETVVAEYDSQSDTKRVAHEIYTRACDNPTKKLDFDVLAGGLAEVIARKNYSSLVLRIGVRDPTAQELAEHYLHALPTAYEKLGVHSRPADLTVEGVLEQRTQQDVYAKELAAYKQLLNRFLF